MSRMRHSEQTPTTKPKEVLERGRLTSAALPVNIHDCHFRIRRKSRCRPGSRRSRPPQRTPREVVKSNALQKPLQPSKELAAVVGPSSLPRTEVVSKVWEYIKAHNLQNPENRREILADDKLRRVFGKDKVTMFEMNKHLAQHLT